MQWRPRHLDHIERSTRWPLVQTLVWWDVVAAAAQAPTQVLQLPTNFLHMRDIPFKKNDYNHVSQISLTTRLTAATRIIVKNCGSLKSLFFNGDFTLCFGLRLSGNLRYFSSWRQQKQSMH